MRAGEPDDELFVNLLMEWQRRLYAFILSLVPNLADADDVLQETNAVLLRKRATFEPGSDFGAWVCRVAYYEVLNYRKLKQRNWRYAMLDESLLQDLASESAERLSDQDARVEALGHCMSRLSADDRALLRHRYRGDESPEAIARRTGRTAAAIRQVLYRIRHELLRCIQSRLAREEHP